MSVKVRPYRRGGWEVRWRDPSGRRWRERRQVSVTSKTAAQRWAEARERALLVNGPDRLSKEVPTVETFAPRFIDGHARANRHKPGGINQKQVALRVHIVPYLGSKRLDGITNEDIQQLKYRLREKAVGTVNNVLTVLNTMLRKAVEWNVMERMPCTIRLLKVTHGSLNFYDFEDYETFVKAAASISREAHLVVLLGGDAGLRGGEIRALEWTDVNFAKRQICVERNDWRGQVTSTKGGRLRYVPLTRRLAAALQAHRHMRGPRVLYRADGRTFAEYVVKDLLARVARKAGVRNNGPHILRHTFISHLAMRGAPARAIQELAGHTDLSTTQRYMHLSPSAIENAIRLLEELSPLEKRGDIVETARP